MKKQEHGFDIRTADLSAVPDISEIHIDAELPPDARRRDVIRQMNGNPYVYRCGGILVKTSFVGSAPLQEVLEDCLKNV